MDYAHCVFSFVLRNRSMASNLVSSSASAVDGYATKSTPIPFQKFLERFNPDRQYPYVVFADDTEANVNKVRQRPFRDMWKVFVVHFVGKPTSTSSRRPDHKGILEFTTRIPNNYLKPYAG